MKNKMILARTLFFTATLSLFFGTVSCKDESKTDSKEVAEEQNEEAFENNDDKEDDSEYLVAAAEIDLKEIELGKLAQEKGTHQEVKNFGKMLVDEHTKAYNELKTVAGAKQIAIPTTLTEKGEDKYEMLDKETGGDFDKKFVSKMVDGHQKAIDKMQKASEDATDSEIRTWAASRLVAMQKHLEHAKSLEEKLK